jgi:hypothetical protein
MIEPDRDEYSRRLGDDELLEVYPVLAQGELDFPARSTMLVRSPPTKMRN